jgi:thiamine biosynthesis protein ThiI
MKFVSLISSGIDSPVATYLFSKKSSELILIHADGRPFTDDREINNFIAISKCLKNQSKIKMKFFIIPHGENLNIYKRNCNSKYTCVFCKRMFLRYAEKILIEEDAKAIIMGDSLGQVASQTLYNIKVIDQAVETPIFRPLIGYDKEDIVKIAKKINTFNISILPKESCSAVPLKPSTRAKLENIIFEEKKININRMVDNSFKKKEKLNI